MLPHVLDEFDVPEKLHCSGHGDWQVGSQELAA